MAFAKGEAAERFLSAIGYSGRPAPGAEEFAMAVDGVETILRERGGRIELSQRLEGPDGAAADAVRLAGLAAGRFLREEAALAWDAEAGAPVVWQDLPGDASEETMRRFFEVFAASCDWWRARAGEAPARLPEAVILP